MAVNIILFTNLNIDSTLKPLYWIYLLQVTAAYIWLTDLIGFEKLFTPFKLQKDWWQGIV